MMWEYGSITFTADAVHAVVEDTTGADGGPDSNEALAAAGAAGWEMVSTFHHPGFNVVVCMFKRAVV
jgi:hypothetical protein